MNKCIDWHNRKYMKIQLQSMQLTAPTTCMHHKPQRGLVNVRLALHCSHLQSFARLVIFFLVIPVLQFRGQQRACHGKDQRLVTVEMKRLPPPSIRFYLTRLAASPQTLVIWHECCRFLIPLLLFVAVTLPGFDALSNSQNCQVCQVDL